MTRLEIATVSRIFQDVSFQNPDTKVTEKTLELSAEYIHLFINEAIVRAKEERLGEIKNSNLEDVNAPETRTNDVVLDSTLLAKVAGILILDF